MKVLIVLLGLLAMCFGTYSRRQTEIEKIPSIMQSNEFTISIERWDLGYLPNLESFIFRRHGPDLTVTHSTLRTDFRDWSLVNTTVKPELIDSVSIFCVGLKYFELECPGKFRRKYRRNGGMHGVDIVQLSDKTDTVFIWDLDSKSRYEIHKMIKKNLK